MKKFWLVILAMASVFYIDNVLTETRQINYDYGKFELPEKPADMTTDPELKNFFDGWYGDMEYTKPLTGEGLYQNSLAVYGRNITAVESDFEYTVDAGKATITRFTNSTATAVVVPQEIDSYPVTTIGEAVFQDNTMLRAVCLCEGLEKIDQNVFYNCKHLHKIVLPSTLTSIGNYVFWGCNDNLQEVYISDLSAWCKIEFADLYSIPFSHVRYLFVGGKEVVNLQIPDDVTSIADKAFYDCGALQSVTFGDDSKLNSIGDLAFYECQSLQSIEIPAKVVSIGEGAFSACSDLEHITVDPANQAMKSQNECVIEIDSKTLILGCKNSKIPGDVTSIGQSAFARCSSLQSIQIPASVISIEEGAFNNCNSLQSVTFGDDSKLTSIGQSAFTGCSSLQSIEIPASVTTIDGAFWGCGKLQTITFGDNSKLISIGNNTFGECGSLQNIEIPASVTSIGESAFWMCDSLQSIDIPANVTWIGKAAFFYCDNLTEVHFANPNGWKISEDQRYMSDAEAVSGLENVSTAAKYLTDTYSAYYWQREE